MRRCSGRVLAVGAILLVGAAACEPAPGDGPGPLDAPDPPVPTRELCSAADVGGAVAVLFARDGVCLPGDDIVLYRCSATDQPVLRVGSETGAAAFLGGSFAVPTETLPANVRFAGSASGMEVLISDPPPSSSPIPLPSTSASVTATASIDPPSEPAPVEEPLVYVRRDGVTERWLRLERRRKVHDPPVAWLIGDSILDGGREAVEAALEDWTMTLDAEAGRPSSVGVPLAQDAVEADADVVLVELGTNDSSATGFRANLVETLEVLKGVPLVLWQTSRGPAGDPTIASVNSAIRETLPGYPNAAIADWEAFVPPEAVETDGVHPDPGFENLESELLTPLLTDWRAAMSGDGALACGPSVVRATT